MAVRWARAALMRPWRGRFASPDYWGIETAFLRGLFDGLRHRPIPFAKLGMPNSACSVSASKDDSADERN
jgi:hypothetical protein